MTHLHYLELDRHLSAQLRREWPQWVAGVLYGATVTGLLVGLAYACAWVHYLVSH